MLKSDLKIQRNSLLERMQVHEDKAQLLSAMVPLKDGKSLVWNWKQLEELVTEKEKANRLRRDLEDLAKLQRG